MREMRCRRTHSTQALFEVDMNVVHVGPASRDAIRYVGSDVASSDLLGLAYKFPNDAQ